MVIKISFKAFKLKFSMLIFLVSFITFLKLFFRKQIKIDTVTVRFQISNHFFISFAVVNPRFVRVIFHCSTVAFWQMFWVDMFVQRFVVWAVEKQSRPHCFVQKWFEESESNVKHPALIDHMNGFGAVGEGRLTRERK